MEARYEILRVHTRGMKIGNDVDLRQIAEETENFTGAELEGLCREAGIVALRENITATIIHDRHFQTVKSSLKPALSKEEIDSYASYMKKQTRRSRSDHPRASTGDKNHKHMNSWLLGLLVSVTIGVMGITVLSGTRDYLTHFLQIPASETLVST